ncbi:Transcriptional regulator, TetR family (fragment) [Cupriavidus taiwanensis]
MMWQRALRATAEKDIDPEAFLDGLLDTLLFGLTAGAARDRPLPPQHGPYIWEVIRDEMLAQRAAAMAVDATPAPSAPRPGTPT